MAPSPQIEPQPTKDSFSLQSHPCVPFSRGATVFLGLQAVNRDFFFSLLLTIPDHFKVKKKSINIAQRYMMEGTDDLFIHP